MPINRANVRKHLHSFDFRTLFIEEMGWEHVPTNLRPLIHTVEDSSYHCRPIAQMSGVSVFEVYSTESVSKLPDAKTRRAIHDHIQKLSHENLLIFLDSDSERSQSLWYWVKRVGDSTPQPREHLYLKGQPGDLFLSKLDAMVIELDDLRPDGTVPITEVTRRLAESLDIERVTKKFYTDFSTLRVDFIQQIEGISKESDRFWYASVLLNRLMFIYFLQKKGFIQNNTRYLETKFALYYKHATLSASYLAPFTTAFNQTELPPSPTEMRADGQFYREFLQALFFEGFAKPAQQRSPQTQDLLGEIKYLNGGLFIQHALETDYPDIHIPDEAFDKVWNLFGKYSWHLDDTPGATDNEINPDVLGYIFEKYINQKAFGAYYTRTEITQYLCERTLHATILERIHENSPHHFEHFNEVLLKLDADMCRLLLKVLPTISILDPACGSGAFLVAAMKTLLDIYAAVYGKIDFLHDPTLTAELKAIRQKHPSIHYYARKRIITDNLYGVDIMQEATEIAKLRLFLALVSAARTVDELEPLPNIDFNIMAGNSLIGLLEVDATRFDEQSKTIDMLQGQKASEYRTILAEKNRLIKVYRHTSSLTDDLHNLRDQIDAHKGQAYTALDDILLDEFNRLGIRYEQAQAKGKPIKRALTLADIQRLAPFHWGYEFDEIMARGGFDIIIANPPWEIFKPQAKEFFADYSDTITKNKMTIKDFEKELTVLLKNPTVAEAWARYQSQFPYLSAYYRNAPQFANQISMVNGKKSGTDINLYKLFTEQAFRLLRPNGECGIVIPSGIYTDLGAKQLREMLFNHTQITGLFGFENRKTIFEGVDSRFKFVVMTYRKGGKTERFPAAFMRHDVKDLERFPRADSLQLDVATIRKLAPDSLSIPELKSEQDIQIVHKMSHFPLLGATLKDKWNVKLTREFDMTNDSHLFKQTPAEGRLPLYEGKMIHQFTHQWGKPKYWLDEAEARTALLGRKRDTGQTLDYQTYRLGFRDVAASTNERTMMMTVLPKNVYCNHKLPTGLIFKNNNPDYYSQLILCALMNSMMVDYLARQRVTANLTFVILYQLPIPRLMAGDRFFDELVERAGKLICTTPEYDALAKEVGLGGYQVREEGERARLRAELDGMVAHVYGLTEAEFQHVLSTFPLVSEAIKGAALRAYQELG